MFVAAILIGLVPFLLGLLFELIVVIPLRVPYDQTPLYFPWQVSAVQVQYYNSIIFYNPANFICWLKYFHLRPLVVTFASLSCIHPYSCVSYAQLLIKETILKGMTHEL